MSSYAAVERDKYERIWEFPEYRRVSPGWEEKERAWTMLGCRPGMSLNDYGAGTGRATAWFRDMGMKVLAIDHARNALETSVPFRQSCLWDMDMIEASDFGFCCDVMEHIPTSMVDRTLKMIAMRTKTAVYFRIATRMDVCGPKLLGEPLHLTVRTAGAWEETLSRVFGEIVPVARNDRDFICIARK